MTGLRHSDDVHPQFSDDPDEIIYSGLWHVARFGDRCFLSNGVGHGYGVHIEIEREQFEGVRRGELSIAELRRQNLPFWAWPRFTLWYCVAIASCLLAIAILRS